MATGANYYYTTTDGAASDSTIWVQPSVEIGPQKWDYYGDHDHSGYITIDDSSWKNSNVDIYVDGIPVVQRVEELQNALKMMWGMMKKIKQMKYQEGYTELEELVTNLTEQEKVDLDEMEKEQEKEHLPDELFKI